MVRAEMVIHLSLQSNVAVKVERVTRSICLLTEIIPQTCMTYQPLNNLNPATHHRWLIGVPPTVHALALDQQQIIVPHSLIQAHRAAARARLNGLRWHHHLAGLWPAAALRVGGVAM
jgi:hypothetical protein